jgi:hypothetical protein
MESRVVEAVLADKGAEQRRQSEKEERKYKYERVATDASDAAHFENVIEESDPELELEIEEDTYRRRHSNLEAHLRSFSRSNKSRCVTMGFGIVGILLFLYWGLM